MTKENKKALAAVAEKIKEAKKEIRRIALEEARRGTRGEVRESMEHAEACLEMTTACAKIDTAADALDRALELADFETRTKISAENIQKRRKWRERMLERVMEIELERRRRS